MIFVEDHLKKKWSTEQIVGYKGKGQHRETSRRGRSKVSRGLGSAL